MEAKHTDRSLIILAIEICDDWIDSIHTSIPLPELRETPLTEEEVDEILLLEEN